MELAVAPELVAAGTFEIDSYLAQFDQRLLGCAAGRIALTRLDPLLFGLVYLPRHMRGEETGNQITLSDFHLDVIRQARSWIGTDSAQPAEHRDAYVAPRGCGKSTWFFLILPLWAAAHRHRQFIAAFADTATQAEMHLQTFKQELERNRVLRQDFPELCQPARRVSGHAVSDTRALMVTESGFTFAARGIDTSNLGMKVGDTRPDLIILDDIEPSEEHYSPHLKDKRLGTLMDAILPLNVYARVVLVGTVTMYGSIVHDLVRSITQTEETEQWIQDEGFQAHYYPAIVTDERNGVRRSIWPAKWPLTYLESIEHTRSYKKNYNNDPMGAEGRFWSDSDFQYGQLAVVTHQVISVDPAVTDKAKSDYTAIAVIARGYLDGQLPDTELDHGQPTVDMRHPVCCVREVLNLRIPPGEVLRDRLLELLQRWPGTAGVLVESNQGGDVWRNSVLIGLGVPVRAIHNKAPKPVRAARLLNHYQRGRVLHERPMGPLEGQMISFPGPFDDMVDAVGTGVGLFLDKKPTRQSTGSSASYI
jgi:hypothetical protein